MHRTDGRRLVPHINPSVAANGQSSHSLWRWLLAAYAYSAVLWSAFVLIISYQSYVIANTYGTQHMPYSDYLPTYGSYYFSLFVITPLVLLLVRMSPFSRQQWIRSVAFYVFFAVVFVFAFATIRWLVHPVYETVSARYLPRTFSSWWGVARDNAIDLTTWMYVPLVMLGHGLEYRRKAEARELETAELLRDMAEQQLESLKIQLQPTFLFATLKEIDRLITEDGGAAEELLLRLSSLLRAAVDCQKADLVTLREELDTLNCFAAIEQARHGGQLNIEFESMPEALDCFVPPMLLQGLAATAVNIVATAGRDAARVSISCRIRGGQLDVLLSAASSAPFGNGPELSEALQNTRLRLDSLYGSDASLYVNTAPDRLTVRLQLPVLTAQVENANA
jgi:two-component system LytT family sensor kinase